MTGVFVCRIYDVLVGCGRPRCSVLTKVFLAQNFALISGEVPGLWWPVWQTQDYMETEHSLVRVGLKEEQIDDLPLSIR